LLVYYKGDGIVKRWYALPTPKLYEAYLKKGNSRGVLAATVDLTINPAGTVQNVSIVSAPPLPNVAERIARHFMGQKYEPALVNCVAVSSTVRTVMVVQSPLPATIFSSVSPVYPSGWSAQHPSACKVPNLLHTGVPAFSHPVEQLGTKLLFTAVRVSVDPSGSVTDASTIKSSGQPAFDDAALAAARAESYPLNESTGFKPVRPSGAMLSWNATHGYSVYSKCDPAPTQYLWTAIYAPPLLWTP